MNVTSSDLFAQARAAHERDLHVLRCALWIAANADAVISEGPRPDFSTDEWATFVAKLMEAQRLARLLADAQAAGVERTAVDDVVQLLFDACGERP
jgi:fructosamine-3-kinase